MRNKYIHARINDEESALLDKIHEAESDLGLDKTSDSDIVRIGIRWYAKSLGLDVENRSE